LLICAVVAVPHPAASEIFKIHYYNTDAGLDALFEFSI
jgi:hypothetical protein